MNQLMASNNKPLVYEPWFFFTKKSVLILKELKNVFFDENKLLFWQFFGYFDSQMKVRLEKIQNKQ